MSRVSRDLQRNLPVPTQAKSRMCTQRGVPSGLVKLYKGVSPPLPTSCKAEELQSVDILTLTPFFVHRTDQAATAHVAATCCHRERTVVHDVTVFPPLSSAEQLCVGVSR